MGWWSHHVMGGDTPLDTLSTLARAVGAPFAPDSPDEGLDLEWHCFRWPTLTPERVAVAEAWLDAFDERRDGPRSIAAQVLACLLMAAGATIPADLRTKLADLIKTDEWAADDDERRQEIHGLLAALASYTDGVAADYDSDPGLLAKMAERMA